MRKGETAMETFDYKVRFPKDLEPQIKAQAEKNGESVNQFVIGAVIAALQPVQLLTVTEQPKETPVTGSKSPIDEKIALMQANERLHALQAKTAAERAAREHGEVKPVIKHPPKWAGLPGQRPDESNVEWVERKRKEAEEIYKQGMERIQREKEQKA
jgi:hypothetical protein